MGIQLSVNSGFGPINRFDLTNDWKPTSEMLMFYSPAVQTRSITAPSGLVKFKSAILYEFSNILQYYAITYSVL